MDKQLPEGKQKVIYRDFETGESYEASFTYRKATKEEAGKGLMGIITDFKRTE